MPPTFSRRQFAVSASATALAATAGVFYGSRDAQAVDVDVQSLQIKNQTASNPTAPEALMLTIEGDYGIDANVVPEKLKLIPQAEVVGSAMGVHEFDKEEFALESNDATGTFSLERNLLALMDLRDLFPSDEGQTADRDVRVHLLAAVYGADGQIGTAETSEAFRLTLEHVEASANVGIEAVGSVRVVEAMVNGRGDGQAKVSFVCGARSS